MLSNVTYIYALIDPRTVQVRYIGKADRPFERLRLHMTSEINDRTHKANWLLCLQKQHLRPVLSILACVSQTEWRGHERKWIAHFRCLCPGQLTNATDGGDGFMAVTDDIRRKISEKAIGNKYSLGRKLSAESKAKISAAQLGHSRTKGIPRSPHTEETKQKLRDAWITRRERGVSLETRKKMSEARKGKRYIK
jgi:hypothetical protein